MHICATLAAIAVILVSRYGVSAGDSAAKVLADGAKVRAMEATYLPGDQSKSVIHRSFRVVRALRSGTLQRIFSDGKTDTWVMKTGNKKIYEPDKVPYANKSFRAPDLLFYVAALKEKKNDPGKTEDRSGQRDGVSAVDMDHLLTVIVTWLSINFGLPAYYNHPNVTAMTPAQVTRLRYGTDHLSDGRAVVAVYDDATHSIVVTSSWSERTPGEMSVLVHEMVHHLQNKMGLTYPCPAAREVLAYSAQEKWLELFKSSLGKEFGIDPMTLKLLTSCDYH